MAEEYLRELEGDAADALVNLIRSIHSIKGSSGTFGLPALSIMAEDFELLLDLYRQHNTQLAREHTASGMLKILTLMREVLRMYQLGTDSHGPSSSENAAIAHYRDESRKIAKTYCFRVLVIDNTATGVALLRSSPKTSALAIEFCRDSLDGLGKLLKENFDALIIGKVLDPMPPDAIFAALKISTRRVPPLIGITSDPEAWVSRVLQPEVILERGNLLPEHLPRALERLVEQEIGQAESDPWRVTLLML